MHHGSADHISLLSPQNTNYSRQGGALYTRGTNVCTIYKIYHTAVFVHSFIEVDLCACKSVERLGDNIAYMIIMDSWILYLRKLNQRYVT